LFTGGMLGYTCSVCAHCVELCVALFTGGMLGYTQEELKSMESQPSPESRLLKNYVVLKRAQYRYTSCQPYCNSPIILPTRVRSILLQ